MEGPGGTCALSVFESVLEPIVRTQKLERSPWGEIAGQSGNSEKNVLHIPEPITREDHKIQGKDREVFEQTPSQAMGVGEGQSANSSRMW